MEKVLKENHVVWDDRFVKRSERNRLNNHKSGLVWLTGLSASGKSTIAHLVERELFRKGIHTYVLDGDNVRHGINSNLGFGREDRKENLRRIAELSKLLIDAGMVVLAAFISPYHDDRQTGWNPYEVQGSCVVSSNAITNTLYPQGCCVQSICILDRYAGQSRRDSLLRSSSLRAQFNTLCAHYVRHN